MLFPDNPATPLIKGVAFQPLNYKGVGGGVRKTLEKKGFGTVRPLN